MDVYLVPLGAERHELYCEVPDTPPDPEEEAAPTGLFRRLRLRFREMLAEAERSRRHQAPGTSGAPGWTDRVKARTMRWVAESIAEQRLLWHLRGKAEACLHYPDDVSEPTAADELRASLTRDFEKHRFWMIIDALAFLASGLLMLIPGPNLIAYFFAFRLVGHYFSLRGARQGLSTIQWRYEPTSLLSELRRAIALEPDVRGSRVREVASRLRLEHLATFFERTAVTG